MALSKTLNLALIDAGACSIPLVSELKKNKKVLSIQAESQVNAGIVMEFITPLGHPVFLKKHQWEQIKSIAGVTGKKTLLGNGELSCFIIF